MSNATANLSDVAKRAGVSKSTVSRVLNNKLGNGFSVKEEVRSRVIDAAKQLNYRPNLIAQSLTKSKTRMISILGGSHALSELGNIYQTVVNNATAVLDESGEGFDVTIDMSSHSKTDSELPAWRVDGVIVLASCSETTMQELESSGIPYVVVNGPAGENGASVVPDDVCGMVEAINHLAEFGHKKIAYAGPVGKVLQGHSSLQDRFSTYLSEMSRLGLEPIFGKGDVCASADKFLESVVIARGATAAVAYGHMGGLNLMQAAHAHGISVPERLSLICFCDEYANRIMSPRLTFIDLRTRDMGRIAAELLLEKIKSPKQELNRLVKLEEKLVLRESTAAPAST
ncbi:Glucose-resistance amylase regulator [Anaerohalosphaera lusitana]|uniref:Glucose-resistance amylase regulator n=1 Tax=Anaerohalosphaera lusitana TaxID=1936003 RepID=A0A1U9NMJ5_9BACT|nr:LacI family DNA-binding transcriptional regulator [Anaerohalosphaera lusitana]AQT69129.1 Glucose-resistance amylase regulator [Anaerohalosphaera lusitana]